MLTDDVTASWIANLLPADILQASEQHISIFARLAKSLFMYGSC